MRLLVTLLVLAIALPLPLDAQSLRGSRASIQRMYRQARAHDLHFYETAAGVERAARRGRFVTIEPSEHLGLFDVGHPYARPAIRVFLERLSAQYASACGERLIVTSAIRPRSEQPHNATSRSVHPTGIAVDLRKPTRRACLTWLRGTLLSLERAGVLEATEEFRPPHFHVAVYPRQYASYVERLTGKPIARAASGDYTVRRGDTLWQIAKAHNTTVATLQQMNGLKGGHITPGQTLRVP